LITYMVAEPVADFRLQRMRPLYVAVS